RVARNPTFTEILRNEPHFALGIVAVPALHIAQRPPRRHRNTADEIRELMHHIPWRRSAEEVVVQLAALCAKGVRIRIGRTHVERRPPSVIEKYSVSLPLPQCNEKRNRLVQRLRRGIEAFRILIPHHQRAPALIERRALLAKSKI